MPERFAMRCDLVLFLRAIVSALSACPLLPRKSKRPNARFPSTPYSRLHDAAKALAAPAPEGVPH